MRVVTARRRRIAAFCVVLGLFAALGVGAAVSKASGSAPSITGKPAAATKLRTATFTFTGPSGASFRCGLDGAATVPCTSPRTYTNLSDGLHRFNVVAVKGNDVSAPSSYTWVVDNVPPGKPTYTSWPPPLWNSTTATVSWSGPEAGMRYECSLDSAAYSACTSPRTFSALSQGTHTLNVRAIDAAGNVGLPVFGSSKIDSVPPPAPVLTRKPTNPTPNATNDFAWTDAEAGVSFQCSLENGAWQTCATPYRWVIRTDNYGQHQFAVRAKDAAGNYSSATTYVFKYQKGQPTSGLPFTMSGSVSGLGIGVWRDIAVKVTNPNPVAIYVSELEVGIAPDSTPSGCLTADNIQLEPTDISVSHELMVPANSSVTLPTAGFSAPQIRLKNLPDVNQDVCKGKSFTLTYSGKATN